MTPSVSLEAARRSFAEAVAHAPGVTDMRVVEAFGHVPREHFVGSAPWLILADQGYRPATSDNPAILYDDIVVALAPNKRINNGQPTLHARCLSAARIRPGERVLHIGCGSGYYTAVLSELVTASGEVLAWDIDPELAAAASANLAGRAGVTVSERDATRTRIPTRDLIYVCAGCTRPVRAWAEALSDGGRLLFPLTPGWDFGGMLMVTRKADQFHARFVCRCAFIPCVGASNPADESAVRNAFSSHTLESVTSLNFGDAPAGAGVWLACEDWWLSSGEVH